MARFSTPFLRRSDDGDAFRAVLTQTNKQTNETRERGGREWGGRVGGAVNSGSYVHSRSAYNYKEDFALSSDRLAMMSDPVFAGGYVVHH